MKREFFVILILMFLTLAVKSQTAQESSAWGIAKSTNTYVAYQSFIGQFPESKFKTEAESNLFNLIKSFPKERFVIYQDFKLRDNPGVNSALIAKLKKGDTVRIIERSTKKEENTIDNFIANDYWYKVELNDSISGWIFGAGLKTADDLFGACKLFIDVFSTSPNIDKVKEIFQNSDCNYWQQVKKEDTKFYYSEYLKYFPSGIYSADANTIIGYIDTRGCFDYEEPREYMSTSIQVEINISEKVVTGKYSGSLSDFSSSEGELSGIRKGKRLILKNVVELSDSDEIITSDIIYLLSNEGLLDETEKILLKKAECN